MMFGVGNIMTPAIKGWMGCFGGFFLVGKNSTPNSFLGR